MYNVRKDLAYSEEELKAFVLRMRGAVQKGEHWFYCAGVDIKLTAQKKGYGLGNSVTALERCFMHLSGERAAVEAFYKKFMLYHMTMGG